MACQELPGNKSGRMPSGAVYRRLPKQEKNPIQKRIFLTSLTKGDQNGLLA